MAVGGDGSSGAISSAATPAVPICHLPSAIWRFFTAPKALPHLSALASPAAGRLMRCLFEVCMRRGWAALTDKALMLSKCVMRRQWGSQTPLRQFKGIPTEILSKVG